MLAAQIAQRGVAADAGRFFHPALVAVAQFDTAGIEFDIQLCASLCTMDLPLICIGADTVVDVEGE